MNVFNSLRVMSFPAGKMLDLDILGENFNVLYMNAKRNWFLIIKIYLKEYMQLLQEYQE